MLSNELVMIVGIALGFIIGRLTTNNSINVNSGNSEDWGNPTKPPDDDDDDEGWKSK